MGKLFDEFEDLKGKARLHRHTVLWKDGARKKGIYPFYKMQIGDYFECETPRRQEQARTACKQFIRKRLGWKFSLRPDRLDPSLYICRRIA